MTEEMTEEEEEMTGEEKETTKERGATGGEEMTMMTTITTEDEVGDRATATTEEEGGTGTIEEAEEGAVEGDPRPTLLPVPNRKENSWRGEKSEALSSTLDPDWFR